MSILHTNPTAGRLAAFGRLVTRMFECIIQFGGLMAAYGWLVDDIGWMRTGGAVAGYAFLVGLVFGFGVFVSIAVIVLTGPAARAAKKRSP
jgi:hypothetical protein